MSRKDRLSVEFAGKSLPNSPMSYLRRLMASLFRVSIAVVVVTVLAVPILLGIVLFELPGWLCLPVGLLLFLFAGLCGGFLEDRRFERRFEGQTILVWQGRRQWRDFCVNNVLPILPSGVTPLKMERGSLDFDQFHLARRKYKAGVGGLSRPFLFVVKCSRFKFLELHRHLLHLKSYAKADQGVQRTVAAIISGQLAELESTGRNGVKPLVQA